MAGRYEATARTRIRRLPKRAAYDHDAVHAVLDAGVLCHVGYVIDGQPYVTPTLYWRHGQRLYWHGSSASRMLRHLKADGVRACVTVSHLDGFVLARSGFHHSVNYRAVMALGTARLVPDEDKLGVLEDFVERLLPGRWPELRPVDPPGDQGDDRAVDGARGGLGQDPHRPAARRRGGLRSPGLGGRGAGRHASSARPRPIRGWRPGPGRRPTSATWPRCCDRRAVRRRPEAQRTQGRSPRAARTVRVVIPEGSSQSASPPAWASARGPSSGVAVGQRSRRG